MKIFLTLIFFFYSSYVFSLEFSKPLWEQTNYLSCNQTTYFSCWNQKCGTPKGTDNTPMIIDFKNNTIFFPESDLERKIIGNNFTDMDDHFANTIITNTEMIEIEFKKENYDNPSVLNFMRAVISFPFGDQHVLVASGICKN